MRVVSGVGPASQGSDCDPESAAAARYVRYADLSGDGVPDAVITVVRRELDLTARGDLPVIEEVTHVASGIGIDGAPTDEYARLRLVRVGE